MVTTAPQRRRSSRREKILAAAAAQFRVRGYDATGIDDIGAAAGITGPGVYRHFATKEEILETLLRERGTQVLDEVRGIVESARSPEAALKDLADTLARAVVEARDVSVVAMYELRTLTRSTRGVIDRLQRLHTEEWVHVVSQLHPEMSDAEARTSVQAVLSMAVAAVNYESGLDDESTIALIRSMTLAGLRP